MPIPRWLQNLIRIFAAVLVVQAVITTDLLPLHLPAVWFSMAFGLVGLLGLGAEMLANAITGWTSQTTWEQMTVRVLLAVIAAWAVITTDLSPFGVPQAVMTGLYGLLAAVALVGQVALGGTVALTKVSMRPPGHWAPPPPPAG